MSGFGSGLLLTKKGQALLTKAQAGKQLKYTRVGIGDGNLNGVDPTTLNKLVLEVKSTQITKLEIQQDKAVIGFVLSNKDLTTGFYFREIGIFALDPDEGEILYSYVNAGANAEFIPPAGSAEAIEKEINALFIVGNASNVTAVIDKSLVSVSQKDFENHVANKDVHVSKQLQDKWNAGQNAKITRDDGTAQLAPDRDINNWHKLGVYSFNEAHVSTPTGFVRGIIIINTDEEGIVYQTAYETDGRMAIRTRNEVGRWGEWKTAGASELVDKGGSHVDSLTKSGIYRLSQSIGIINGMPDSRDYFVQVFAFEPDGGLFQIAYAYNDTDDIYFRSGYKAGGQWSFEPWRKVLTKTDIDPLIKNSVSIKNSTSKDLNAYREPGLFFIGKLSDYTNRPINDDEYSWGILRVETLGTTAYVVQSYTCVTLNVTFTRSKAEDASGRGWLPWVINAKLNANMGMDLPNGLTVYGEGPVQRLYGNTHQYTEFHPTRNSGRSGYIGASNPAKPSEVSLSADNGDLVLYAKDRIFVKGRDLIGELDSLKTSGVNARQGTVDALNAKGQAASMNDEWPTLHQKIRQITTGVPIARIKTNVSEYPKNFLISEGGTVTWGLYYIMVTGLSFQAKGIVVLNSAFRVRAAFDFYTNQGISVDGAHYNHQVVYRDVLPQLSDWSILATITPNSFIVPVIYGDSESKQQVNVIVYG